MAISMIRLIFFVAFPGFLTVFPAAAVGETTESPRPLPAAVGEQITADVVNLIFLFDRAVSKPPRVTTRNYIERISDPSSPLYRDYLDYREHKIDRIELVNRLPHVAMLGDSLTQHFYASAMPSAFWRARTSWRENWFLDTDPDPKTVFSVYERLERISPLVVAEYNGAGAMVAPSGSEESLREKLVRVRNLPGQGEQVLRRSRFPDLIMIWIGHNNLDWVHDASPGDRAQPENRLREIATRFRKNYAGTLQALIDRAKSERHKVAIVVFGLANIEAYLEARRQAEALHAQNPKLYSHVEDGERTFESLKPPYRQNMARLASLLNGELQAMVGDLNDQLRGFPAVRLQYSDELTKVDFSRLEMIHPVDAWHPSEEGHKTLAEAAFKAILPSVEFLGLRKEPNLEGRRGVDSHDAR
jgi:lysophospholipase L1-like esterase